MNKFLYFAFGFLLGAYLTESYCYKNSKKQLEKTKKIYEDRIDDLAEEIAQYKLKEYDSLGKKQDEKQDENLKQNPAIEQVKKNDSFREEAKKLVESARNLAKDNNYIPNEDEFEIQNDPYEIEPEKFGEFSDYDTVFLTYYKDGVLADDMDDIVSAPKDIVGNDFESYFGTYEEDVCYVRNDIKMCDYEITRDPRSYYEDVEPNKPTLRWEDDDD